MPSAPGRPLAGRVALVTGSASGIGRAVALRFLADGAHVVGFDVSEQASEDPAFVTITGDVRAPADLDAAVATALDRFGQLDIVAAVAGLVRRGTVLEQSDADRDLVFAVNIVGVWNTARAALPAVIRSDQGRIIVCSSVQSVMTSAGLGAYSVSKHAVVGFVKALALEVAEHGVTVNAVAPGTVATERALQVLSADQHQHLARTTPIHRSATPDEVASMFAYLAGPDAGYVSGANLLMDGALHAVNPH